MGFATYALSDWQDNGGYPHPHPERTLTKRGKDGQRHFTVYPDRDSMLRAVAMIERRGRRPDDWTPMIPAE